MKISLPKLKSIILYFCYNTNPRFLGKVKLMKLFYFLDFVHVKKYGTPVTHDNYINLEHGPVPSGIFNLINTAEDDIDNSMLADVIKVDKKENLNIKRIVPLKELTEMNKKYFSKTELDILEEVCIRFKDKNTKFIEKISHTESPWKCTNKLQSISYKLASKDKDCLVSEEEIMFLSKI